MPPPDNYSPFGGKRTAEQKYADTVAIYRCFVGNRLQNVIDAIEADPAVAATLNEELRCYRAALAFANGEPQ